VRLAVRSDEAKRKLIDTLGRRRPAVRSVDQARERRSGEILTEAFVETLEGKTPGEPPASGALITRRVTRDSRKGQSPGTAARRAGPSLSSGGYTGERNGTWVHPAGNGRITFREENAPKGKSHGRCRYETRPARV
jgi:hypothetical protein